MRVNEVSAKPGAWRDAGVGASCAAEAPEAWLWCVDRGGVVETARGPVVAGEVSSGDSLIDADGIPLRVLLASDVAFAVSAAHDRRLSWPHLVRAGAFSAGVPARDSSLTCATEIFAGGIAGEIADFANGTSILRVSPGAGDAWRVLLCAADGSGGLRMNGLTLRGRRLTARDDIDGALGALGDPVTPPAPPFDLPRSAAGALGRRVLADRAFLLGHVEIGDPGLFLLVGDRLVAPDCAGVWCRFEVPDGVLRPPYPVRLVSRHGVPAVLVGNEEKRRLGVAVSRILAGGREIDLRHWALGAGWHDPEPGWRWTSGAAELLLPPSARKGRDARAATDVVVGAGRVRVRHLADRLEVDTGLSVPAHLLRLVVATRTGREFVRFGPPVRVVGSSRVAIGCDLARYRGVAGRRLQLWACGFLLHDEALGPLPDGAVSDVAVVERHPTPRFALGFLDSVVSLRHSDPAAAQAVTISSGGKVLLRQEVGPGQDLRWVVPDGVGEVVLEAGTRGIGRLTVPRSAVASARACAKALLLADREGSAGARAMDRAALPDVAGPVRVLVADVRDRAVTVIVPVHGGVLETQSCLASVAASMALGDWIDAVIVVDDAAPEPMMTAVLGAFGDPGWLVLRHAENRGFAASVGTALASVAAGQDVILLNADTIVPAFFAERLHAAAHARADIASATPLSNAATVLSLPDAGCDNALSAHEVMQIDAALQAQGAAPVEIPTGVGFCLYLTAEALADVGGFGLEWGAGYGEEVDWCLRARDRGWSHVAACDVAVFHQGQVSFGAGQRAALMARNHPELERRFPEYVDEVRAFLRRDPLVAFRVAAFCRLIAQAAARCILQFTHAMGGGTAILVAALSEAFTSGGGVDLVCSRVRDAFRGEDVFRIVWTGRGLSLVLPHDDIVGFVEALRSHGVACAMRVHSLTGVGPAVRELAVSGIAYVVHVHDYQWICPRIVLVDQTGQHCGEPGPRYCQLCVRANPIHDFASESAQIVADLPGWIAGNAALLAGARAVVVPSVDCLVRLQRHFPAARLCVAGHPERQALGRIDRAADLAAETRIAVVGGLSVQKGRDVLLDLCRRIDAAGAPFAVAILGGIEDAALFDGIGCVRLHGAFERDALPAALGAFDPHFVLFPAVWPETWCFALSDVWAAGYPVVAFDIGAIAERVRATGAGVLLPYPPDGSLLARLSGARAEAAALFGLEFDIGGPAPDLLARGLFFSAAVVSQAFAASVSHFFMKLVLAAPASFFSVAVALQVGPSAQAAVVESSSVAASRSVFMAEPLGFIGRIGASRD
eukprot:gene16180-16356_t